MKKKQKEIQIPELYLPMLRVFGGKVTFKCPYCNEICKFLLPKLKEVK
jgi:uncharacterized Zn-finger protein